jgi:hypothetical protein
MSESTAGSSTSAPPRLRNRGVIAQGLPLLHLILHDLAHLLLLAVGEAELLGYHCHPITPSTAGSALTPFLALGFFLFGSEE